MEKALGFGKKSFIYTLYKLTELAGGFFGLLVVTIFVVICLEAVLYITQSVDFSSTPTQAIITNKYPEENKTTDYYLIYRYEYEQNDQQVERISEPKSVNQDFYDSVEIGSQIDYDTTIARQETHLSQQKRTRHTGLVLI